MKKNNTDRPFTPGFRRMCIANFLLFASVYIVLLTYAITIYLPLFAVGMVLVGPFHSYLGDAYKRKHVYIFSTFLLLLATIGHLSIEGSTWGGVFALLQGVGFGLAVTAGITLAIDVTHSECRTQCNIHYALAARLGMSVGIVGAIFLHTWDFRQMLYLSLALGLLSILFATRVHVAFRAPIGVGLCNIDRFLLPRAWAPALNVLLKTYAVGLFIPMLYFTEWKLGGLLLVVFLLLQTALSWTKMFVNLSQHCQRGTANTTAYLATDSGVLLGLFSFNYCLNASIVYPLSIAMGSAILSLLFYFFITIPYYKKHRVR